MFRSRCTEDGAAGDPMDGRSPTVPSRAEIGNAAIGNGGRGARNAGSDLIRILVAMRFRMLAFAVAALLGGERDFEVVGIVHSCAECACGVAELLPNVLLCDMGLGRVKACKTAATLGGGERPLGGLLASDIPSVVIHDSADEWPVLNTIRAGSYGHLTMDTSPENLFRAIRAVRSGGAFFDASLQSVLTSRLRGSSQRGGSSDEPITRRQHEVLLLLSQGKRNQEIAAELFMSLSAVKHHVSALLTKLQASNRTDAVRIGMARGMLSEPS